MYQDFTTIYRAMRAGTWDHVSFQHMAQRLQALREQWEAGEIDNAAYRLQAKTVRTVYEMKQRHTTLVAKGVH